MAPYPYVFWQYEMDSVGYFFKMMEHVKVRSSLAREGDSGEVGGGS